MPNIASVTRTLQNFVLAFGSLRLRWQLQPLRTRALVDSYVPAGLRKILPTRPKQAVLDAIGLGDLANANELIDRGTWSLRDQQDFKLALAFTTGDLAQASAGGDSASALDQRIARAAKAEIDFLTQSAISPRGVASIETKKAKPLPTREKKLTASILHVLGTSLPYTLAGYTLRTQSLLTALQAAGVTTAGVTRLLYPVDRARLNAPTAHQVEGVTYLRALPQKAPKNRSEFQQMWAKQIVEVAKATQARLLHPTTDFPNGVAALTAAADLDLPVVYEVRGFLEESAQSRYERSELVSQNSLTKGVGSRYQLSRAAETAVMKSADAITTLSEGMKAEITNRGVAPHKVHVMPNGVNASWLDIRTDSKKTRREIGVESGEFLVGLITTFSEHEGIPTLLAAVRQLRDDAVPIKCVLIGDGPTFLKTKSWVQSNRLSESIVMVGRLPQIELPRWYQALDLFVLPRINARVTELVTPLKPLEAMALGVTVAATSVGGMREIVEDGVTGALFSPDDPRDCAATVQSLLYDSARRNSLSEAAREWVAKNRTWTSIAQRYVKLYQELGAL